MTAKTRPNRESATGRTAARIFLPHHSWTRREPPARAAAAITADDFWTKLGL
ncbi:hypothetical protein [Sphingobium amiense]|uniref:hypothetical protein n=1 Tax=Sphingobium amiense TaxID=135719 RepID=UPI000ADA66F2|nr:hypothetical protein [Sphingobium amiense]